MKPVTSNRISRGVRVSAFTGSISGERPVRSARGPNGAEITQGRRKTQERLMFTQNLACPPGNGLVGIDGKGTIQERGVTSTPETRRHGDRFWLVLRVSPSPCLRVVVLLGGRPMTLP